MLYASGTLVLAALALAAPTAKLHVWLQAQRPAGSAIIHFGYRISAPKGAVPPALTRMQVGLPAGMGIDMSGLPACAPRALRARGPRACPRAAKVGGGRLEALMPLGELTRSERAQLSVFKGPTSHGRATLLFSATGRVPIVTRLTFVARIEAGGGGSTITADIPVEPTLPGQPDAAVMSMTSTIGAIDRSGVAGGRPRGVTLPRRCPRAGLPFGATFAFDDGSEASAQATAPCGR